MTSSKSPGATPFFGGIRSWRWYFRYLRDPLRCFSDVEREFGSVVVLGNPVPFFTRGRKLVIAIGSKYNRIVLGQPDLFRPGGQVMRGPRHSAHRRLRNGIFAMYGPRHQTHRRMMQPPLLKPEMPSYAPDMARLIDQIIDTWQTGATVDMYKEMRTLSNWIAAHLLFGADDFQQSVKLGQAVEQWLLLDADARQRHSIFNIPGTRAHKLIKHAERLETLIIEMIERSRRAQRRRADVLSRIVQAADNDPASMNQQELVAHAAILYAASFETTANVLAWTLFLIAQHPGVARALFAEVTRNAGDWPPSLQALDEMKLLDGVIKESLRLMPPVAFTFRSPLRDVEIDELQLKPSDKIVLAHYHTLRDASLFPEPDRFAPERWQTIRPDSYDYPVFSSGPRLCLGITFAQLELKMAIARIVQRFSFRIPGGTRIDARVQLTLRPAPGIPMLLDRPDVGFAAGAIRGNVCDMIAFPAPAS